MTHGYEFFEYDYIDLDEGYDYFADFNYKISDKIKRDSKGHFTKGHIPWNRGQKIGIYEGLE